jgi:hypothetical protein
MGPDGAAYCCHRFFPEVKYIVPMHYEMPILPGTIEKFYEECKAIGVDLKKIIHSPDIKDNGGEWKIDLATLD